MKPLCFVLAPFGTKPAGNGVMIDFDQIYAQIVRPAIELADLEPLRADEEQGGGIIHKPMFERLLLCDYAVADLTSANANVFYELGVRHAAKDRATALIFANGVDRMPFDVRDLRALPYTLTPDGKPAKADVDRDALATRLRAARQPDKDSPIYQLVDDYPDVAHEKTDVFRDRVQYASEKKSDLAARRKQGMAAIVEFEEGLKSLEDEEAGVLIDLMMSYRACEAWDKIKALEEKMPAHIKGTVMVREQYAMALNRAGDHDAARVVLEEVIDRHGPSSETLGLLGRVYKDQWDKADNTIVAKGFLKKAIEAYRAGFDADIRDAYPGINAATLMELSDPPMKDQQAEILPVVRYAVLQRLKNRPDYWDHATLLEIAVLGSDRVRAEEALADALPMVRESFEPKTTARNLRLIYQTRKDRSEDAGWVSELAGVLEAHKVS